jgi:hypothetical protein
MTRPDVLSEVRLAGGCSAAIERGELGPAALLAERGLALAEASGNKTWIRRFQHLLRVARGGSIEGAPHQTQTSGCSLCLGAGPRNLTAGALAFICDECLQRCLAQQLEGSPLKRLSASDLSCSFCRLGRSEELYGANGYYICMTCVERYAEFAAENE